MFLVITPLQSILDSNQAAKKQLFHYSHIVLVKLGLKDSFPYERGMEPDQISEDCLASVNARHARHIFLIFCRSSFF